MCGRYILFGDGNEELREILDRTEGEFKTGEIFPTDKAPILIQQVDEIRPVAVSWGFPGFRGNKGVIINARAETVPEKPMFRKCLEGQRCIIPSSGFFEWSHDGKKTKYQFNLSNSGVLYMAGLYQTFGGEARFVIITTDANKSMSEVHNRMPVVLGDDAKNRWMESPQDAVRILSEAPPMLIRQPV